MPKMYRALLLIYLTILGFAVFTPRRDLDTTGVLPSPTYSGSAIPSAAHNILYLDGALAWIGNFFLLMPLPILIYKAFGSVAARKTFLICVGASIVIECVQHFIPGRSSDWRDFVLNVCGAGVAIRVFWKTSK